MTTHTTAAYAPSAAVDAAAKNGALADTPPALYARKWLQGYPVSYILD